MSEEILKVLEKLKNKSNYQRDCNDESYFIELFANEIYILCKFMEDLQQKVEQLENIRKEAIEYINHATIGADSSPIEDSWLYDLYEAKHILNKGSE